MWNSLKTIPASSIRKALTVYGTGVSIQADTFDEDRNDLYSLDTDWSPVIPKTF